MLIMRKKQEAINLAPFKIERFYDGAEVFWLVEHTSDSICHVCETREEAVAERNRLNSSYGLDQLGI
tara:strand:+ start:416 stop:616 length:201 start_codon:yes stop_codon:yes gene_type:complete